MSSAQSTPDRIGVSTRRLDKVAHDEGAQPALSDVAALRVTPRPRTTYILALLITLSIIHCAYFDITVNPTLP